MAKQFQSNLVVKSLTKKKKKKNPEKTINTKDWNKYSANTYHLHTKINSGHVW